MIKSVSYTHLDVYKRQVVNFAAESHVDRSITNPEIFVQTNVLGTVNLLNIAKNAWAVGDDQYKDGVKSVSYTHLFLS